VPTFGVLGSGDVGRVLSKGLKDHGYEVRIGSRTPAKLGTYSRETGITAGTFAEVGRWGEALVLSVKGSAAERAHPAARFVKAFNAVGSDRMVDPDFQGIRPTMFYCGNDAGAKATVARISDQFGWEAADMGGAVAARAIEPLAVLWCIPGFLEDSWTHAFKLLR
jgi:8-hydroxy-5-deazaflavin:NADPH oxidoreductase